MSTGIILLLVLGAIAVFFIVIYNRLVALRREYKNAFADIDVQLKQRYDLIPNLVETVKGYAAHEKGVLEAVTQARADAMNARNIPDRIKGEMALSGAITNLLAVAESYPDLKANQNFLGLQSELSDIENKIAASRRFFNNAVTEYNTAIEQFPSNLVASMFKFEEGVLFEIPEDQRATVGEPVKVSFG